MARKDLLASVTASLAANDGGAASVSDARSEYTRKGASRSMLQSLDEMAEASMRLMEGEAVVSLDTAVLDGSFLADRIGDDIEDFEVLKDAIRQSGQSTPILVRPHPDEAARYQIIFGHRRARAARELGIAVKAVIRRVADIEHAIAQGQENTARADLTFIEKALYARRLLERGMTKDVAKTALTIDDTLLSRMLSVAESIPESVLDAIGAGKGIGRDRWEELKKLVLVPANAAEAVSFVSSQDFANAQGRGEGFNVLLAHLKAYKKPTTRKVGAKRGPAQIWTDATRSVVVTPKARPKGYSLDLSEQDGKPFGEWIMQNLDDLYAAFRTSRTNATGD